MPRIALIVEDDPLQSEHAAALLGEYQLETVRCDSAEAALSFMQYRGGEVALIFADVRLAGVMDGVALARAVSKLWPQVVLVVTSGSAPERRCALPATASFLPKPWRGLDVLAAANRAMDHPPLPVS
jgi:DNA-binding NtrC family response regulator